jgi:hypothetical protein
MANSQQFFNARTHKQLVSSEGVDHIVYFISLLLPSPVGERAVAKLIF